MGREPLVSSHNLRCWGKSLDAFGINFLPGAGLQKSAHPEPAGVPGGAHGRQGVVGAGNEVDARFPVDLPFGLRHLEIPRSDRDNKKSEYREYAQLRFVSYATRVNVEPGKNEASTIHRVDGNQRPD